ncbi:hypothetical protein U9M48_021287 [Paspalum notatum var. saurae]|uniref:Uncharacterized protein n=1 Tax=Paspalum notatum var. saurae TaxID=547442 RepID=A0AAQ3TFA3_PASNO
MKILLFSPGVSNTPKASPVTTRGLAADTTAARDGDVMDDGAPKCSWPDRRGNMMRCGKRLAGPCCLDSGRRGAGEADGTRAAAHLATCVPRPKWRAKRPSSTHPPSS